MTTLSFSELSAANLERCEQVFHKLDAWSPAEWGLAAAGEMGEACNKIKKQLRGDRVFVDEIGDELADTVIYLDLLAQRLGLDLGECVRHKFNVVSDRRGSTVRL